MSLQSFLARGKANKDKDTKEEYKKEDITLRFMRKIATPLAELVNPIAFISPNRLTWIGFSFTVIGGIILYLAGNNIILLFLVGLSFWIAALFDCADGQLARLRGISSKKGAWLDSILEEGKGIPFFLALGFHLQDVNGNFTLRLGETSLITLNVWFTLFIMYMALSWLSLMALWGNMLLDEPRIVSQGNTYIIWIILILNILDWFLFIYTIIAILAVLYTLFEKTFLYKPPNEVLSNPEEY